MKESYWKYENGTYRGRVKKYHGAIVESIPCAEVRTNKLKALEDAQKLLAKLKRGG